MSTELRARLKPRDPPGGPWNSIAEETQDSQGQARAPRDSLGPVESWGVLGDLQSAQSSPEMDGGENIVPPELPTSARNPKIIWSGQWWRQIAFPLLLVQQQRKEDGRLHNVELLLAGVLKGPGVPSQTQLKKLCPYLPLNFSNSARALRHREG